MATVTLKYTKLNSSLSVGDYVFYMTPATSGSYTVEDSFGGRYLGRVKSIAPPTNPPLVIQNVELPFFPKSYSSISNEQLLGNNKFYLNKTMAPNFQNEVPLGSIVWFIFGANPTFSGNSGSVTLVNHDTSSLASLYLVEVSGDMGVDTTSSISGQAYFGSLANQPRTIHLSDTTGIEVGNTVTGTSIPGGTTVSTISTNSLITVNKDIIFPGVRDLTFTGTDNFHTVVIEADSNATMPLANDYFYFTKDRSVDSSGVLGYYAEVKMQDTSTTKSELYSVSSEIFESSK